MNDGVKDVYIKNATGYARSQIVSMSCTLRQSKDNGDTKQNWKCIDLWSRSLWTCTFKAFETGDRTGEKETRNNFKHTKQHYSVFIGPGILVT